jgi:hypothetical protein
MNSILVAILFILIPFIGTTQENYFAPPDSSANWYGYMYHPDPFFANAYYHYTIPDQDYDTIIGEYTYTKFYRHYGMAIPPFYDSLHYIGAFRTDTLTKRVYFKEELYPEEKLFFDFGISRSLGSTDTILFMGNSAPNDFNMWELHLVEMDSVLVDGIYYKTYTYQHPAISSCRMTIMERFLSAYFPLKWDLFGNLPVTNNLMCYTENGVQIRGSQCPYTEEDFAQFLNTESNEKDIPIINIYPNPNQGNFVVRSGGGEFQLYNLAGKLIHSEHLSPGEHKISVDCGTGIYVWKIETENNSQKGKLLIIFQ